MICFLDKHSYTSLLERQMFPIFRVEFFWVSWAFDISRYVYPMVGITVVEHILKYVEKFPKECVQHTAYPPSSLILNDFLSYLNAWSRTGLLGWRIGNNQYQRFKETLAIDSSSSSSEDQGLLQYFHSLSVSRDEAGT